MPQEFVGRLERRMHEERQAARNELHPTRREEHLRLAAQYERVLSAYRALRSYGGDRDAG